jgi:hypothetical protein
MGQLIINLDLMARLCRTRLDEAQKAFDRHDLRCCYHNIFEANGIAVIILLSLPDKDYLNRERFMALRKEALKSWKQLNVILRPNASIAPPKSGRQRLPFSEPLKRIGHERFPFKQIGHEDDEDDD